MSTITLIEAHDLRSPSGRSLPVSAWTRQGRSDRARLRVPVTLDRAWRVPRAGEEPALIELEFPFDADPELVIVAMRSPQTTVGFAQRLSAELLEAELNPDSEFVEFRFGKV